MRRLAAALLALAATACGTTKVQEWRRTSYDAPLPWKSESAVGAPMVVIEDVKRVDPGRRLRSYQSTTIRELVYAGLERDGVIRVTARQTVRGVAVIDGRVQKVARTIAPQSLDLRFDLATSRDIAYHGVKLRVDEASNSRIVFTILDAPARHEKTTLRGVKKEGDACDVDADCDDGFACQSEPGLRVCRAVTSFVP